MMTRGWLHILFLLAVWGAVASSLPTAVRLSSSKSKDELVVRNAMGEYEANGEANGVSRYKRLETSLPQSGDRFLFRSKTGRWSIANTEKDVAESKKILMMSSGANALSPVGLAFRYYAGEGKWEIDPSFSLSDISLELAGRKRKHAAYSASLAAEKAVAEVKRAWLEREVRKNEKDAARQKALETELYLNAAREKAAREQQARDDAEFQREVTQRSLKEMRDRRAAEIKAEKALHREMLRRAEAEAAAEDEARAAEERAAEAELAAEAAAAAAAVQEAALEAARQEEARSCVARPFCSGLG